MKKLLFFVAVATLFFSCQKEIEPSTPSEIKVFTFKAFIENLTASTKANINDNQQLVWAEGDKIGIYVPSMDDKNQPFVLDGEAGSTSGSFKWVFGDFTNEDAAAAYFPWEQESDSNQHPGSWQNNVYDGVMYFKLRNEYWSYSSGKMLTPLVAKLNGSTDPISFKHAGAAVKLTINNLPAGAYSVTMTADKQITGNYHIDPSQAGTASLALDGDANSSLNTVKLNYGDSSVDRNFTFIFPVPAPLSAPKLTFTITDKNGFTVWTKSPKNAQPTLSRKDVLEMPALTITPYSQFVESDTWTFCGNIDGSSWHDDIPMVTDGNYCILSGFTFKAGDKFKIRKDKKWDEAYPSSDWVFTNDINGAKDIIFNIETHEISVIDHRCPYPTVNIPSSISLSDDSFNDWELIPGSTNGTTTLKVAADATNMYVYVQRTSTPTTVWGGAGYVYLALDLDNNESTGDAVIWNTQHYEYYALMYPYAGTSAAPAFNSSPGSSAQPSPYTTVSNIALHGVESNGTVTYEILIPRADL